MAVGAVKGAGFSVNVPKFGLHIAPTKRAARIRNGDGAQGAAALRLWIRVECHAGVVANPQASVGYRAAQAFDAVGEGVLEVVFLFVSLQDCRDDLASMLILERHVLRRALECNWTRVHKPCLWEVQYDVLLHLGSFELAHPVFPHRKAHAEDSRAAHDDSAARSARNQRCNFVGFPIHTYKPFLWDVLDGVGRGEEYDSRSAE